MSALAVWTMLLACWGGVRVSQEIGQNRWIRFAFALVAIAGLAALLLAIGIYRGSCSGEEFGVERVGAPLDWLGEIHFTAWVGGALLCLSLGFGAAIFTRKGWIAFAAGVLAFVLLGSVIALFVPGFLTYCAPTPIID